ncbi:MAG: DUF2783 domain-containing protein [Alphaproteobacteria bacterium]|nr:DUF2783 domain-containing protein [Alphaproteobacteria bacterium]
MSLKLDINTTAPDDIYDSLIRMHEGLDDEQSAHVNARMILLLANHIGDPAVIAEAARIARSAYAPDL